MNVKKEEVLMKTDLTTGGSYFKIRLLHFCCIFAVKCNVLTTAFFYFSRVANWNYIFFAAVVLATLEKTKLFKLTFIYCCGQDFYPGRSKINVCLLPLFGFYKVLLFLQHFIKVIYYLKKYVDVNLIELSNLNLGN